MFWFQKYKKIVFSLYSQKQIFENRKQKLLPNISLGFYVFRTLSCIVGKPWSKQCV